MSSNRPPLGARVAAAVLQATPDWSAAVASRTLGTVARLPLTPSVARKAVDAYIKAFTVNTRDVEPLELVDGYETFNSFFTRPMRTGARAIDRGSDTLVSPCDGYLRDIVDIGEDMRVRAKGCDFDLPTLLADQQLAQKFVGGSLTSIYLHPRDYHRVHAPCEALGTSATLVPGRLLPVTDAALEREPALFAVNERLVIQLDTTVGPVAVVMVAAFGVGHMSCVFHRFRPHGRELQVVEPETPVRLRKGDELGTFHLGSTVLVLAPKGVVPAGEHGGLGAGRGGVVIPRKVRLGEPLLREAGGQA